MDYRRIFGLRKPCPIGDSTFLEPQLENFALFSTPFLDIRKKIGKLIKDAQKDTATQLEKDSKDKRKIKQAKKTSKDEKVIETSKKESDEVGEIDDSFGIVLNVVTVLPEELAITFGEGNEIEVKVEQQNVDSEMGGLVFSRKCYYKYELPNGIDKKSLVALRTSDDYLIILPLNQLRDDALKKSIAEAEEIVEAPDEGLVPDAGLTEDVECETETSEEVEPKKPSRSKQVKEKSKPKTPLDKGSVEPDEEAMEVSPKANVVFFDENSLIPVRISRMLRPPLDIFMLRKYLVDLESYASTARKYIENASFITQNSKTAERCIRFIATSRADEFFEEPNIKDGKRKSKILSFQGPDSGYTSHSDDSSKTRSLMSTGKDPLLKEMLASPPRE